MKNFVQPGVNVTVTAPYALTAGDGCLVGILFGIAAGTYLSGATDAELVTEGVFDITALSTDTASGSTLVAAYWDNTNKRITTTVGSNTKVGVIVAAKTSGQTTARVRLNATF
jgi:predicted RecA/RadA family phage recombinase